MSLPKPYSVCILDPNGDVISRCDVEAASYQGALQQLRDMPENASRIEVFTEEGTKAGEMRVPYWRQRVKR